MIRLATKQDLKRIDAIAKATILNMAESGIPQWTMSYPRLKHFEKDFETGHLFVNEQNNTILGAMVLKPENDPPYETITGWTAPHGKSLVIHRVVVDPKVHRQGIFQDLMDFAIDMAKSTGYQSIKIDTHHGNYKMHRFLEKNGYRYIGYLDVIDREAYELTWEDPS